MDDSPLLLAIETAASRCAVALARGNDLLADLTLSVPRAHAAWLTPMIDQVLRMTGVAAGSLSGVAVSMGPGSYTGLRIGVSTAKGLCFAHGLPLIGVPTLDAIATEARAVGRPGDLVLAALPSRRDEVYLARYRINSAEEITMLSAPAALALDAIAAALEGNQETCHVAGEAASLVVKHLPAGVDVRMLHEHGPSGAAVAQLGMERLLAGDVAHLADFEPFYVNAFIPREKSGTPFDRLPPGGG